MLLSGCGGGSAAAPPQEHVQNGDMAATAGWSGVLPSGGLLTIGPGEQAINTLSVELPAGAATLRYVATATGSPSGVIRVRNGSGTFQSLGGVSADGSEVEVPIVVNASAPYVTLYINEVDEAGTLAFSLVSITT